MLVFPLIAPHREIFFDRKTRRMGDTVILGSGIVGVSTAYYLSHSGNTKPESIHLVDPIAELFHCASGFAGGFLAKDCKEETPFT